jgi:hypothetical protein
MGLISSSSKSALKVTYSNVGGQKKISPENVMHSNDYLK